MARKYHTASGKNGSNKPPKHEYAKDLLRQERDRLTFEVLRAVRGLSNREAAGMGCSPATIANWRKPVGRGGTRFPRAITMSAVLREHHKRLKVVDIGE